MQDVMPVSGVHIAVSLTQRSNGESASEKAIGVTSGVTILSSTIPRLVKEGELSIFYWATCLHRFYPRDAES